MASLAFSPEQLSPEQLDWCTCLLDSHRRCLGRELIARSGDPRRDATLLFEAPAAILSHDSTDDPVFRFGNRTALELFELSWSELLRTPSRLSAEPDARAARATMLARVERDGFIDDYSGVRVSSSGRRFEIQGALIWNVTSGAGTRIGQAASFSEWRRL